MIIMIKPFTLPINIAVFAAVHPSEDPDKVKTAICNVFDGTTSSRAFSVHANSTDLFSLEIIRESIRTRTIGSAYRRNMMTNTLKDTTWFYLNKQAAFAGHVAICKEADESPLGPIKITITCSDLMQFIDWFVSVAD